MPDNLHHMDARLKKLRRLSLEPLPVKGWISALRTALGMTTRQLARRMGISQPRIVEIEREEISGKITIASLDKAAAALGCRFVYAIVPDKALTKTLAERAHALAEKKLATTEQTMRLENQAVRSPQARAHMIHKLAESLLRKKARLWDEE